VGITRINANGFAVANRKIVETDFESDSRQLACFSGKQNPASIDVNSEFRPLKKTSKKVKKKLASP